MRNTSQSVMLFAAGFGTRMGSLTADRPKPLIKVKGKPLIDHTLDLVTQISPETVVVNTHYLGTQIEDHLADRNIKISNEWPNILETGGGLRNALPLLGDGPIFTSNTDAIWNGPNPFSLLRDHWNPDKMDALLCCIPIERTMGHKGSGDFAIDAEGRLSRKGPFIYGGVQILKTDLLDSVKDRAFSLNVIWDKMREKDRLFGAVYSGQWCDVGQPESIALAEDLIRTGNV